MVGTIVGSMTQTLIDQIVTKLTEPDNRNKIEDEVIDPIVCYILDRLYPYIFGTAVFFVLLLILSIVIMIKVFKGGP